MDHHHQQKEEEDNNHTPSASTSTPTTSSSSEKNNNNKQQDLSEDSSYDSDCELSPNNSHYDVSRTVSDTLGAEFAEYVTTTNSSESDPQREQFAKKLGYSSSQLATALSKLGPNPTQNELLSELISLDSQTTSNLSSEENNVTTEKEEEEKEQEIKLRKIIIDGSNIAMSHGRDKIFSCRGIEIVVDYFKSRGHSVTVFLPSWRKEDLIDNDKEILTKLESEKILVFTPSRNCSGGGGATSTSTMRRMVCYDDRYILELASSEKGIVVSNDNYRDLLLESPEFRRVIENQLLMFSFVGDRFMPPSDPLGRNGPTLAQFLSHTHLQPKKLPCPYGKKCTYGSKCKYHHDRMHISITETLRKQAAIKTQSVPISFRPVSNQIQLSRTKSAVIESSIKKEDFTPTAVQQQRSHKKLQRQLSINPSGDPRIWSLAPTNSTSSSSSSSNNYLPPFPSDPALSSVWSPVESSASSSTSSENNKPNVYYHLCAIFPREQVLAAMEACPGESDPGVICKEIVKMFG